MQVVSGYSANLALKTDGTVQYWGVYYYNTEDLDSVVQVAIASSHIMVLKADSSIVVDGVDKPLWLGYDTIKSVIQKAAGYNFSLSLTANGKVIVSGNGIANLTENQNRDIVKIATGLNSDYALKTDSTVVAWGNNSYGQTNLPNGMNRVLDIWTGSTSVYSYAVYQGFKINTAVDTLGTITASTFVFTNSNYTVTFNGVNNAYTIDSLFINGIYDSVASKNNITSYTFNNIQSNKTIRVKYKIKTFLVSAANGENGSITPIGDSVVLYGQRPIYIIQPTNTYVLDSLLVNGVKVDSTNSYTFDSVFSNRTIRAVFKIRTFTIFASAGFGGNITPAGIDTVPYGARPQYSISAQTGYVLDSLLVNGVKVDSTNSYTFDSVFSNRTIRAVFKIRTFTITKSTNVGGSITPAGIDTVPYGARPQYSISAQTGYVLDSLLVNNIKVDAINSYTFDSIKMNQTIRVVFKIQTFTIFASAGFGGNITPAGNNIINYDSSQIFIINANDTFIIDSVFINGRLFYNFTNGTQAGITQISYRFNNVRGDSSLKVVFRKIIASSPPVNIVATSGNIEAFVNFSAPLLNNGGNIIYYTVKSNKTSMQFTGFSSPIIISGLTNDSSYTFVVIATNQWEQESIPSVISNVITPSANLRNIITSVTNGTITEIQSILIGQSFKITYAARTGYEIDSIFINGIYNSEVTRDSISSYTFVNVQTNVSIKVVYKLKIFTINTSVQLSATTCIGSRDGIIRILFNSRATQRIQIIGGALNIDTTITGTSYILNNIDTGRYKITISTVGTTKVVNYTARINSPAPLTGYSTYNIERKELELNLSGGKEYKVTVNGKVVLTTTNSHESYTKSCVLDDG